MAFKIDQWHGGEVDFLKADALAPKQFQEFKNLDGRYVTSALNPAGEQVRTINSETALMMIPGQGFYEYRAEWDDSATPRQASTLYRVIAGIVDSAGAWEINIRRNNAKSDNAGTWGTEFIDETSSKGTWERATSSRLVQGSSNITFTAATDRISGHANLENYEVGEIIRVFNTTDNNGYFTVKAKAPASNSVDVQEDLTDESNVSAYLYPLPDISMFAVNGDLRVSNGNFYDDHASQWYGHIKRDFWGQGITYGSNSGRYSQPPMKEAYNNWKLQNQELVAPLVLAGGRLGSNTELLYNIGFEVAGAGGANIWANWLESAGSGALANESTNVHSGNSACKATWVTGQSYVQNYYTGAFAGDLYGKKLILSFWTRGDGSVDGRYRIYDLSNGADIVAKTSTGITGTTYTRISEEFIVPSGCNSLVIYLYSPSSPGDAYFDDVSLYFDNSIAIHIAGSHHEFKELMPNSIDRTFTGGGTAWANVDLNAFNETTDLTITATAKDQYCTLVVASAPMTAGGKYKFQFDVDNLIGTFTIQDFMGVQKFGNVYADGEKQSIKFTVDSGITGGFRLVADSDDSSADFDNFSLSSIDWPEKAVDVEWNARDRITATFIYDFVQESELGKAISGEIGISMGTIVNDEIARAFMAEVYTGLSNVSWNRRITAIRLYYKFYDDPDWYEIVTLNVNKGWSESELIFDDENTGYWRPIMFFKTNTGTSDATGGSGTTLESDAHGLSATDLLYIGSQTEINPDVMCTIVASQVTNTITLPVAAVNSLGLETTYDAQPWCAGTISTTAVATFYIPFTGEKAFTYFTNTGRAARIKVPAIRWRACDTDGSRVLYGNIDTKDDNDQTIRERSRVIETSPGMPDTALLSNSKDVGLYLGDEIKAIKYYNGYWWVMMERHVLVLQTGTLKIVQAYSNSGCKWQSAFAVTPFGICVADETKITLLPSGEEITFLKRETYQALSFFECNMGYDKKMNELRFMPDSSHPGDAWLEWIYSFNNKSWRRYIKTVSGFTTFIASNYHLNKYNAAEYCWSLVAISTTYYYVLEVSEDVTQTSWASAVKTKEYDHGFPNNEKIFGAGYLVHKSSGTITVEIYLNGSSTVHTTREVSASASSFTSSEIQFNVQCKFLELRFTTVAGTTVEYKEFEIPDKEITVLDR